MMKLHVITITIISNIIIVVIYRAYYYTVSQKTVQNYFCQNFVKFRSTVNIFGIKMA